MRKSIIAFVFGACLLPDAGFTLGLGEIEVNSALNQQLDADIALLSATPEDAEQLIVKLASSAEFNRAGIDRPYFLTSLRFSTEQKNGQLFIKVTSPKPIREPFLNFLVEIDWPKGHLLREYTILLDPPVYMGEAQQPAASSSGSRPAVMQQPAAAKPAQQSTVPSRYQPPSAASTSAAPASRQPPAAKARAAKVDGSRRIQAGDTAWSLANAMRPDQSVSVEQMMIAMLRANPEVFINNNVNGLKRGYILRAPDHQSIAGIDPGQALALVREQNALWREYQQALAGGTPASALQADAQSASATSEAAGDDDARLSIVSAGSGEAGAGSKDPTQMSMQELRRELALASEQLETERVEKEELNARVEALQAQVEKMKSLLTIEDQSMARMQAAAAGKTAEPLSDEVASQDGKDAGVDETQQQLAEAQSVMDEPVAADNAEAEADTGQQMTEDEQPVFVDEQADAAVAEQGMDEMAAEAMSAGKPLATDEVMETMPGGFNVPKQESFIDKVLGNKTLMAAIGGGVLLLAGLLALLFKRRKSAAEESAAATQPQPVEDELEKVADMVEDEVVGDTAEQLDDESSHEAEAEEDDFDAESTMVLSTEDTVVTQADETAEEGEEDRDDVIAEADVYLAYGIYQQAEELLQKAIEEHPDRDAYRVKLAETHYASKNADAFVEAAEALKKQSGTGTRGWAKVVAMGKDLCPDNDLFSASDMVDGIDLDELAPKVPEMDFDLDSETDGEADADLDFSLDEQPLDLPEAGAADDTAVLEVDELEFDLSETEAVAQEMEQSDSADDEFTLDIDADELDIDVKDVVEEAVEEAEIDISDELDETLVTEATEAEAATDELDMMLEEVTDKAEDGVDELDAMLDEAQAAEPAADTTEEAVDADLDDGLGDLDDVDEVATKLDLARAYLDMGDSEGTRSILDEVLAEGNDEQKKEAQELLDRLG